MLLCRKPALPLGSLGLPRGPPPPPPPPPPPRGPSAVVGGGGVGAPAPRPPRARPACRWSLRSGFSTEQVYAVKGACLAQVLNKKKAFQMRRPGSVRRGYWHAKCLSPRCLRSAQAVTLKTAPHTGQLALLASAGTSSGAARLGA